MTEPSKLFELDINYVQYKIMQSRISSYNFRIAIGDLKYKIFGNSTCSGTSYDILNWASFLKMEKSKVKVPKSAISLLDATQLSKNGVTRFKNANPYSIYHGFIKQGYSYYDYKFDIHKLSTYIGKTNPTQYMLPKLNKQQGK